MQISNIGIVGAGTMGSGIAQVAALTGYDIVMQDVSDEVTSRGLSTVSYTHLTLPTNREV